MAGNYEMSSHRKMDEIIATVKQCFPKAHKFRILENSINPEEQNYLSEIIRLTVEYEEDEIEMRKFLILKIPKNTGFASVCSELNLFITEAFVYETIIPRINEYLDESLTPFHFKTATDSKILILENLTTYGYEEGENNRQLYGLNQCFPVLKAIAHFHATTRKIGELDPDLLNNKVFQYPTLFEFKKKTAPFWERIFCEQLAKQNASLIPKVKNAVLHLQQNYEQVKSSFHQSNFKFSVINHGDIRKANVLLKTDTNGDVGVKIIDFQTCFWSSPVYDFMYFFILSTEADVIDNHYEALLDWYLQCLNEKLKQINCSQMYEKQNFIEDLRILRICTIFHITTAAALRSPVDRDELLQIITQGKKENNEYYREACLNDKHFTQIMLSILKFFDKIELFEPSPSKLSLVC